MAIQFWNNQILFVGGQIAMDPACCCPVGCHCAPNLPDVLYVHYPLVGAPENAPPGATHWTIAVTRAPGAPYPPHIGDCVWVGEADAGWGYGSCGTVFLWLDPDGCVWRLDNAYGTRTGNTPLGTYSGYVLNTGLGVEVTSS